MEVVAFLTAASFLQMWHVVDKCTELLESNPAAAAASSSSSRPSLKALASAARRGSGGSHHLSPDRGSHHGDRGGEESCSDGGAGGSSEGFGKMAGVGGGDFDQLLEEGGFSPQGLELGAPSSGEGCSPPPNGQNGGGGSNEEHDDDEDDDVDDDEEGRPKAKYVPPSIMGHRKWSQVKTERPGREDCTSGTLFINEMGSTDSSESYHRQLQHQQGFCGDDSLDDKLANQLDDGLDCDPAFDDPLDFYGSSMDRYSSDQAGHLDFGRGGEDDEDGMDADVHGPDDVTNLGPGYKLYQCKCGKSFTHKSQRDRHMSMHLGLRPYGCAVCGKSFKMKHHLVGHMKIHTGIKPYECSMCSKRFMWRDSFNRHTASCRRIQGKRAASANNAAAAAAATAATAATTSTTTTATAEQSVC